MSTTRDGKSIGSGLDGHYPYALDNPNLAFTPTLQGSGGNNDVLQLISPKVGDNPTFLQKNAPNSTESYDATMYLMYEAAGGGPNDWVPFASVTWTWTGSFVKGKAQLSAIKAQASKFEPDYPSWTSVVIVK